MESGCSDEGVKRALRAVHRIHRAASLLAGAGPGAGSVPHLDVVDRYGEDTRRTRPGEEVDS